MLKVTYILWALCSSLDLITGSLNRIPIIIEWAVSVKIEERSVSKIIV